MLERRKYRGQTDLREMQGIVRERTRVMGPCTNLHPGDIAHRIYSGLRKQELEHVVPVWEDSAGIAGFGIVWPQHQAFDVVTRIGLEDGDQMVIIREIAEAAEDDGRVEADVIGNDVPLTSLLSGLGFKPKPAEYVFTQQRLDTPITVSPHDFTVRSVSVEDAKQLAAVHGNAFGSCWTPEEYATRMQKPGYTADDEIVAVDSDGTFMGFTITWYDHVNMVGYFEPVGVHTDFHRRGVGSVLVREGMARMQAQGMNSATVWHAKAQERAIEFYRSNGFAVCSVVNGWERTSSRRSVPVVL